MFKYKLISCLKYLIASNLLSDEIVTRKHDILR